MLKKHNVKQTLSRFEKDLVNGYYRFNSDIYVIPNVVMKLSMLYLWIFDEFVPNNAINDTKYGIQISGLNNTICECIEYNDNTIKNIVFSKNILVAKNYFFYHWRFIILSESLVEKSNEYNFIIGVKPFNSIENNNDGYSIIGSHGLKLCGLTNTVNSYSKKRFYKKNDILDMYLNLDKGELSYMINNNPLGIAYTKLDTNIKYKMYCKLLNKNSKLELISYHSSNELNNEYIDSNYIQCIYDANIKIKYFDILIQNYNININNMNNEILNDYIDCLLSNKYYDKAYDLIIINNNNNYLCKINAQNLCKIASWFYFEINNFSKALNIFKIIGKDNDMIFVENHLCVEVAFCYEHSKKEENMLVSVKYYLMALKYENKLQENGKYECLHHLGALYFNFLYDYKLALDCFLKISYEEINRRDLETAIASCYDQLNEYESALKWFKKYETKYKNKISVLIAIALIYYKNNNNKKAEKYFRKALDMDKAKKNWTIHCKYGYYLLNGKHDYDKALNFFLKALSISLTISQKSESYKCIGACYDKIGDMSNAIHFTQKVLEINPNDADALNNAGYFYLRQKKYKLAYSNLIKSLEIYPSGELTTGNIGICLFKMNKYNDAIPYLEKAIYKLKSDLQHKDVGPFCLYCYAQILYRQKNDYNKSIKILKQLIKHKQFNNTYKQNKDDIYYLLSRIYKSNADWKNSMKFLKKAKKFNPRKIYENQIQLINNNALNQSLL